MAFFTSAFPTFHGNRPARVPFPLYQTIRGSIRPIHPKTIDASMITSRYRLVLKISQRQSPQPLIRQPEIAQPLEVAPPRPGSGKRTGSVSSRK